MPKSCPPWGAWEKSGEASEQTAKQTIALAASCGNELDGSFLAPEYMTVFN
jgi:hypothetical protein